MTGILVNIIIVIVALIMLAAAGKAIELTKEKVAGTKYEKVVEFIEKAVKCAEQIVVGSGLGEKKKQIVYAAITKFINDKGVSMTDNELDVLIEAAVYTMNNSKKDKDGAVIIEHDALSNLIKTVSKGKIDDEQIEDITKAIICLLDK